MNAQSTTPSPEELLGHSRWLRALARSLVLDDAEADDLVQETWLAVLSRPLPTLRDPRAWLAGVARNLARREGRRAGARRLHEREAGQPEAVEPKRGEELARLQRDLTDRVLALDEPYRSTLLARFFEELPPRAIAQRDRVPLNTVKSRIQRGLAQLRTGLDESHGDRRTWGMALLSLARGGATKSLGAWGVASAVAVGLIVAGFAFRPWWSSANGEGDAPAIVSAPAEIGLGEETNKIAAVVADEAPTRREVPAAAASTDSGSGMVVTVVDDATGQPVPGAVVRCVDQESFALVKEEIYELIYDHEQLFDRCAREVTCDARGRTELSVTDHWLLRCEHGGFLATRGGEEGGGGEAKPPAKVELRLKPVSRLEVRVVDGEGHPVTDVPVAATMEWTLEEQGEERIQSREFRHLTEAPRGVATFWDGAGIWSQGARISPIVGAMWTELRIDLPGVGESDPFASDGGRIHLEPAFDPLRQELPPFTMTLPETGALEVVVLDADGSGFFGTGTARIELAADIDEEFRWDYEAPIEQGRARFPRVMLGFRFKVAIDLPEEEQSWTVTGAGPASAGETAVIESRRASRDHLSAELVDAAGTPIARTQVQAYLDDRRLRPHACPRATSDAEGRVRIALEPEQAWRGTVTLVAHRDDAQGNQEQGMVRVEWGASESRLDLGRLELEFVPSPLLRGRCVDPAGEPIEEVLLLVIDSITGRQLTAVTDSDGAFSLPTVSRDAVVPTINDLSGEGRRPTRPDLRIVPDGKPVEIVLGTLGGEFRARLELPSWCGHASALLVDPADPRRPRTARVEEGGEIRFPGLDAGRYDFHLNVGGLRSFVVVSDVLIVAGPNRDPRVDAIDLTTLLRPLRPKVFAPDGEEVTLRAHLCTLDRWRTMTSGDDGLILVPLSGVDTLRVFVPGYRLAQLADPAKLPDEPEIRLEPGLEVEVVSTSEPEEWNLGEGTISFVLQSGRGDASITLPVPPEFRRTGTALLRFPAPGEYRVRCEKVVALGALTQSLSSTTKISFEIHDTPKAQRVELDL